MTGQDAIKSAGEFNRRIGLTGVVLSKMDGDARGGAALSVVVGGRRADRLRRQRRAPRESRALPSRSRRLAHPRHGRRAVADREGRAGRRSTRTPRSSKQKLRKNEFTLGDFRDQLRTIRKMGPLEPILGMLPGMGQIKRARWARRREGDGSRRGDHQLDDARRARAITAHQRQPAQAHRARQRHVGRGRQPPPQAVRRR